MDITEVQNVVQKFWNLNRFVLPCCIVVVVMLMIVNMVVDIPACDLEDSLVDVNVVQDMSLSCFACSAHSIGS